MKKAKRFIRRVLPHRWGAPGERGAVFYARVPLGDRASGGPTFHPEFRLLARRWEWVAVPVRWGAVARRDWALPIRAEAVRLVRVCVAIGG
jgi:hypothetical protein